MNPVWTAAISYILKLLPDGRDNLGGENTGSISMQEREWLKEGNLVPSPILGPGSWVKSTVHGSNFDGVDLHLVQQANH